MDPVTSLRKIHSGNRSCLNAEEAVAIADAFVSWSKGKKVSQDRALAFFLAHVAPATKCKWPEFLDVLQSRGLIEKPVRSRP